ncbi:hypothetical protein [Longimicrobium sp.]|uniref:hypothetical protein n=1 Tax=Longimicrobium sp. TaxID=2029185 RepID=UPI003B3BB3B7
MPFRACAAAAAALLSLALPAAAQTAVPANTTLAVAADTLPRTSLQKGNWSLSFTPPGYSGGSGERAEFGAWEMVGERTNLGLVLAVSVYGTDSEASGGGEATTASTDVGVGVNVKRYLMTPRDVTPFLIAGASIGGRFERRDGPQDYEETTRGMNSSVLGGVGVEWFPTRRFSLSGQTGFMVQSGRYETETDMADDHRESETRSAGFRSFTSALSMQIYF